MGSRIPNRIRNRVAQQWVMGVSRDIIAKDNQIGTGTVSTIIHGFKDDGFILTFSEKLQYCSRRKDWI
jgi:hypothetical protein